MEGIGSDKLKIFESVFEHASEGIILSDDKGKIIVANGSASEMFLFKPHELINAPVELLIPDRLVNQHRMHRKNYNENPHKRQMGIGLELFGKRKDGNEFPIEISLSPLKFKNQNLIIIFLVNISKRKEIEMAVHFQKQQLEIVAEKLKQSNEALETRVNDRTKVLLEALNALEKSKKELSESLKKEKELNELKSRFLSMASHEFRTPLTTILSSASLISEYKTTEQEEKRERHVQRIKNAVNNLNDILSDFISISRIEEGKVMADFKQFNITHLASEVVNEVKLLCKNNQSINYTHQGEGDVLLDSKMTRNILINLLSNAIKFSGENSVIELETATDHESYYIKVTDCGIGISSDDRKHLFERFFRGKNAANIQGTGLGLNIVANYLDLMGGRISVESELNKGTTIKIRFPITDIKHKASL